MEYYLILDVDKIVALTTTKNSRASDILVTKEQLLNVGIDTGDALTYQVSSSYVTYHYNKEQKLIFTKDNPDFVLNLRKNVRSASIAIFLADKFTVAFSENDERTYSASEVSQRNIMQAHAAVKTLKTVELQCRVKHGMGEDFVQHTEEEMQHVVVAMYEHILKIRKSY